MKSFIRPALSLWLPAFSFLVLSALPAESATPPQPPQKVTGKRSADAKSFTITWSSPSADVDGTALSTNVFSGYRITRINTLNGTTSQIFTQSAASPTALTDTGIQGRTFFYKIQAANFTGELSTASDVISSDADATVYVFGDDGLSYAALPTVLKSALDAENLSVRGRRAASLEGNKIFKVMNFEVVDNLTGEVRKNYLLDRAVRFAIGYAVDGNGMVSNGSSSLPSAPALPSASSAKTAFSIYWFNGSEWIKLSSTVDTAGKVAAVQSRQSGQFQMRLVQQTLSPQLNATYPRTITPNGDGINDIVFFLFENPSGAPASGSIYDMRASKVADARATDVFSGDSILIWDGKDDSGSPVTGGVYLYKLAVGEKTFTGTVMVAR